MAVGIYKWAVIVDHLQQKSYLVGHDCEEQQWHALIAQFSQLPEPQEQDAFKVLGDINSNMDEAIYALAFNRIKRDLKEGDCYQVNLAQRFVARCEGDPWTAYQLLRELNAAPFSCYLNLPEVQILSSSPERFLKLTKGVVETKPIKGTRPRKQDDAEDPGRRGHGELHTRSGKAPIKNESANGLKNARGSVAMARYEALDSATSQFLINIKKNSELDDLKYCVFGKVVAGMDVVDAIAKVQTGSRRGYQDIPTTPVAILSATVLQ